MITIIITAYNVEKTIARAINSCLSQSFSDLEILIINDCSIDNTLNILNSYTDSRIKVITNDINIGAGLSRRKGTKEANGEYTIFLDGDDWLDDDYVETLYKYAKEYNADVVSNGIQCSDGEKTTHIDTYDKEVEVWHGVESVNSTSTIKRFLNNKLIRRTIWDKVDYSDRRYVEDTQTSYFVLFYSDVVVNIKYAGYHYYQNPVSLCHQAPVVKTKIYQALCAKDLCEFVAVHEPEKTKGFCMAFIMRLKEIGAMELSDSIKDDYKDELAELFTFFLQNIKF